VFTYTAAWLQTATGSTLAMIKMRTLVGDTDSTDQQFDDAVYFYAYASAGDVVYGAASVADMLAAKYVRLTNLTVGATRISNERLYYHAVSLADRLRKSGPGDLPGGDGSGILQATAYVGGQSLSAKDALDGDGDNNPPDFKIGQDDFPGGP
jgi:hypothetical protein